MRLPVLSSIVAMVLKASLISGYYLWQPYWVLHILVLDSIPLRVANWTLEKFFWQGIAPRGAEDTFNAIVILGTGVEMLLVGLILALLRRKLPILRTRQNLRMG